LPTGPPGTVLPSRSLGAVPVGLGERRDLWEGIFGPADDLRKLADTIDEHLAAAEGESEFCIDGWDTPQKEWRLRFVVKPAGYDPAEHGRYV